MLIRLHGRRSLGVVFAFLVAGLRAEVATLPTENLPDHRLRGIQRFFGKQRSPLHRYAKEFLRVADHNRLDWRLLPCIATVESSAGRHYKNHNVFGWANGRAKFSSIAHGIAVVGGRLANAPAYRAKSTEQKLFVYNPKRRYVESVLALMDTIQAPEAEASAP